MKLLAGLLVCICAVFLIASGGQDQSRGPAANSAANVNAPGVFPICKTPITMNLGIRQNTSVENYETNHYSRHLEEKGNVKFT